jgi:Mn-dependent DtxR family transcriptional regulator
MAPEWTENDVDYLRAIIEDPDPVLTAPEVAELMDVSQQAAYQKLAAFERKSWVGKKKVGARAVVWYPTTDGIDIYKEASDSGS